MACGKERKRGRAGAARGLASSAASHPPQWSRPWCRGSRARARGLVSSSEAPGGVAGFGGPWARGHVSVSPCCCVAVSLAAAVPIEIKRGEARRDGLAAGSRGRVLLAWAPEDTGRDMTAYLMQTHGQHRDYEHLFSATPSCPTRRPSLAAHPSLPIPIAPRACVCPGGLVLSQQKPARPCRGAMPLAHEK